MTRIFVCSAGDAEARRHLEAERRGEVAFVVRRQTVGRALHGLHGSRQAPAVPSRYSCEDFAGSKASVGLGRRSLLPRLLDRGAGEAVPEPRVAFVDDGTEQRAPGAVHELAVAVPGVAVPAVAAPTVAAPEDVHVLAESAGGS